MFYLRLNKIKIINNRELLGKGEIQFMSFINAGEADFPMLDDFYKTNDDSLKKKLVAQAVTQVIGSRIMPQIQKVKHNQTVYFGDSGYIVYKSGTTPADLNWMLIAMESDSKTRDNAALAEKILTEKNIGSFVGAIAVLASMSNPVSLAITTLSTLVAKALTEIFKNDKDDQAGLLLTSFIEKTDYPHGKKDAINIIDSTGNMFVDFTIFAF